jgi:integrase
VGHDWVYTDQLKATRSRRSLALAPFLTELLRDHLRAAPPSEFVFSSPHGEIIRYGNFRKRYWDPAVARSGLDHLTPHALRHTCVAMMIAEGRQPAHGPKTARPRRSARSAHDARNLRTSVPTLG